MNLRTRSALLGGVAASTVTLLALTGGARDARADSVCAIGLSTTTCTAPNGTVTTVFGGGALVTNVDPSAVVYYSGNFSSATVTGNIESSTTPLKGVLNFDALIPPLFTYVGTGSLLDSTTTGSTALRINAPSAVINTGALSVVANGGTGLSVISSGGAGSGGITTVVDGNITATNGNGVIMTTSNAAADGALNLTINSGNSVTASNGTAVNVNTAGAGNITITNNGGIGSSAAGNNTLSNAIIAQSTGTGSVSVNGTGQIGTAADRAQLDGINASINNAASAGAVSVTPTGSIYSVGNAIDASTNGTGTVTVGTAGTIDANGATAILVNSTNAAAGNVAVSTASGGTIRSSGGNGINATTAGSGSLAVTSNSAISSSAAGPNTLNSGIVAASSGTGGVSVSGSGSIGSAGDRAQGDGIDGTISNGASTANVSVTPTGSIYSVGFGVLATNQGTGGITVTTGGVVDSSTNVGIYAQQTNSAATGNVGVTANGDVRGASGIFLTNAGTGSSSVATAGNVSASGGGGIGVTANNAAAGPVTVTTTAGKTVAVSGGDGINVTTVGSGNVGITSNSNITSGPGGPGTLQNGIVVADSGTGAVSIAGSGAIGTAADRAQANGVLATISNGASPSNISIGLTGAGGVYSVGRAIQATTTGTGNVTVGFNGPVNSSTAEGVYAQSNAGLVTVSAGGAVTGATDGINANSITGNVRVDANANVSGLAGTGIYESTQGTKTVNVAAGRSVTGTTAAITFGGTGAATVNNSGTVGAASTGLALNNTGTGAVTFNNLGGATLNGRLTFNSGADALINAGTFNTQGITDFGAGADVLTNTGTITLAGATTFANLETFGQGGILNLGTNTLTGSGALNNTGTINTAGSAGLAGFTTLSNSGTLNLAAGTLTVPAVVFTNSGTINATSGTSTITGQTGFANSGLINLQDGAADDMLTIASNFSGSGGSTLAIDASNLASDRLVITGSASGSTLVNANLIGSGLLTPGGLLVVDTNGSTTGAFTLGAVTGAASPLVDVALVQNGVDYYLNSTLNATGFAPLAVGIIGPDLWYQSADAYIEESHLPNDGGRRMGLWGQLYFGHDKSGGRDDVIVAGTAYRVDNRVKTDRYGAQLGYGFALGGMGTIGVTGGYGHADTDGAVAGYSAHGWNIGAYGLFGGVAGIHGAALVKYDNYKVDIDGVFDGANGNPDVKSWGVDGEVGYKFGSADAMWFDVYTGLSYVSTKIDNIALGSISYDYDRTHSTRGRLGARATWAGDWGLFADAKLYHEFAGNSDVTLSDGINDYVLRTHGHDTWGRLSMGVGGPGSGIAPELSGWVDVGDVKGFGVRAGMRF